MNRYDVMVIAVCGLVTLGAYADKEKEAALPTAAKQSLNRMDAAVVQAKKKAVAELTAVMNQEVRAGHTEVATAIGEKIKEISADVDALQQSPDAKKGQPSLTGTWRAHNTVQFVLEKNNTFSASGGNFKWTGKWTTSDNKLIVDSTQFVDTYDLPPQKEKKNGRDIWSLKGKNNKGEPIFMEKEE